MVDAVRILTANGPTGGDLNDVEKLDTVIAGADIVAADSYAATLFDLRGEDIPYVRAAAAMGLGEMDLSKVESAASASEPHAAGTAAQRARRGLSVDAGPSAPGTPRSGWRRHDERVRCDRR